MAWEIFRDNNPYEICKGREFRSIKEPEYCMGQMVEDTINLLKEQAEQIAMMKMVYGSDAKVIGQIIRCKDCKHRFITGENVRYAVCELNHNRLMPDDWFCADWER